MVAHHAQHVVPVFGVAWKRSKLLGHFGRRCIGHTGHDGRECTTNGAAFMAVIGNAIGHQQSADVGKAQAEGTVFITLLGDFLRRELRHENRDFQNHGPQANAVLVSGHIKLCGIRIAELQEIERGKVTGRVIKEHVFRAGVRCADFARCGAGVPVIDGGVILNAGIGRGPCGLANLVPKIARLQGLGDLVGHAGIQVPRTIGFNGAQELVGHTHRVVGVLAGNRAVGFAIPIGVIGIEFELRVALLGKLHDALDVIVRHHVAAGIFHRALEGRVLFNLEAVIAGAFAIHAGLHDDAEMLLDDLGAGDECCNLLLLLHLPIDVFFDIGMIDINDNHLGRTARGAARLDGACCTVTDLEEAHQARGFATAREFFAFATEMREVRAGAGAIFEQARFTHPEIHDATFVDEIVGHALNEAGMGLWMLIG